MRVSSVSDQLFFTTVRIETTAADGSIGTGTGFFFNYSKDGIEYPFVVTNKHVAIGQRKGSLHLIRSVNDEPSLHDKVRFNLLDWPIAWFGHPDPAVDIAICPFNPVLEQLHTQHGTNIFFRILTEDMIPTDAELNEIDSISPVTFVGYPNGIFDKINSIPVARRGHTATPLGIDFEGGPKFIIDASVFGGSSGSPVFVTSTGRDLKGNMVVGDKPLFFVGVIAAVYFRTALNEIVSVPIPTHTRPMAQNQEMLDLGIVFKAKTVVETIEAFLKSKGVM